MSRRVPPASASEGRSPPLRRTARHRFTTAIVTGTGALVALGVSSALGNIHGHTLHEKLVALIGALGFLVLAVLSVQSAAGALAGVVTPRAGKPGGTAVRVIASFVGYVVVLFIALGLLAVPVQHLLLGGALTGVIVGIAAQQALGNVFAGLVLLLARPFTLDERIRVRAGALGGVFEGVVRNMTLVYVTVETDDGPVNVPNSAMLASGVGPAPEQEPADLAVALSGAPPVEPPDDASRPDPPSRPLARAARLAMSGRRQR